MHSSIHSSPGKSRSVQELFCSFSSIPRSPSPTKQDLYEMLQSHRMHSFSRRMRTYMQDIGASPETEVPSFMRPTCSSLTKRNTAKSRSRTMSPSAKESWDSAHLYSGGGYRRLPKSMTGKYSDAFTVDEDPRSGADSSVSRLDAMTGYPVELGYSTSACRDIHEQNKDPTNEHNLRTKDGGLLNSQGSDVPRDSEGTRGGSVPSLNGSLCSGIGEEWTSLNAVRTGDNEGSFEQASMKKTFSSELAKLPELLTTDNLTTFQEQTRRHSEPQSQARTETHKGVLWSAGPHEQGILLGNEGDERHEAMTPESSLLWESPTSSLHLYTSFSETGPRNDQSTKRGSFNELQSGSPQRPNEGDQEGDGSSKDVHSTMQSDSRQQLASGSRAVQDQGMRSGASEDLSNENSFLRTDSKSGDIVFAESNCLESRTTPTQEISDSRCTSSQSFHSFSSLNSITADEGAFAGGFNVELLETEVLQSEESKDSEGQPSVQTVVIQEPSANYTTLDQQSENLPEVGETTLATLGAPTKSGLTRQDSIVFASISSDTLDETVDTTAPVISTLVYAGEEISDSEDDFSDNASVLFVQNTVPRSLHELSSNARPPIADEPAQSRDDHASILLQARPTDLSTGQAFSDPPDPVHQGGSSSERVCISERSGAFADSASPFVPRDHQGDLASKEEGNGEAIDDNTVACRQRSTSLNGLHDDDVINSCQVVQSASEIEAVYAPSVMESIELGSVTVASSSYTPEEAIVHSSVPEGARNANSVRFPKLLQTISTRKENKRRRRRRFRFSLKSCFGCSAAPSVLGEPESASETRNKHRTRGRNNSAPSN